MREIKVFAPATVANVACGFDIFGFALELPGDEVVVRLTPHKGVRISQVSGDGGKLSLDPQKNTAGVTVLELLKALGSEQGVEIELHKKMPLGSGLGSSAASGVGSLFALNILLGQPLSSQELLPCAVEAERVACGAPHADNVAPALLGGFILIRSYQPLDVIKIPCAIDLFCAVLHPKMEISTAMARQMLKADIPLQKHVIQTGNVAALVVGLMQGDSVLIGNSLQDVIVEPVRSTLIPGFAQIKAAAMHAGALGCSISGSGPSLFALALERDAAEQIGQAMAAACQEHCCGCDLYISKINQEGPKVLA